MRRWVVQQGAAGSRHDCELPAEPVALTAAADDHDDDDHDDDDHDDHDDDAT